MGVWIIAVLCAFFIKGLCGFANTLVMTSILSFGVNNVNISPVDLAIGYPPNIIMVWKNRAHLRPKVCIPVSILVLIGSLPGAILLKNVDARAIKIVFGVAVVFLAIEMYCRDRGIVLLPDSKLFLGIIGLLSGVLCGLFGVGALLAVYITRMTETNDEFKCNISAVFLVENTFRIVMYLVLGVFTIAGLKQALLMFPFMLIGLFAGMKCATVLDEKVVKKLVIVLLIISGVMLIVKNL